MKYIIIMYGMNWVWVTLVCFLIVLLTGFFLDIRFAIIACMILFLLFPMELVMIYFYYGLKKEFCFNVVDHRIIQVEKSLRIEMGFHDHEKSEDNDNLPEDEFTQIRCLEIPLSQIGKFSVFSSSIALKINNNKGFVWIPVSAFDDDKQFKDFIDNILAYAVNSR